MHRRHLGLARLTVVALLAALGWLLAGAPAGAQGDTATLQVGAILCADHACLDPGNLAPGFTITALDNATGDEIARCTTDAGDPHLCTLELPAGGDWSLAWDDAQVPEGYAWRGDLYPVADGPLGTATLIPFVPLQGPAPTAAPIESAEPGHVTVQAALCADAGCDALTEYLDRFLISAVDPDTGEIYSSCATGNAQQGLAHQCILDVPAGGGWDLTWSSDQVPAGYTYVGEPIESGEPAVTTIAFAPATEPAPASTIASTAAPVTTLPTTGSGPGASASTPWMVTLLAVTGVLLAALALAARARRPVPTVVRRDRDDR